MRSGLNKKIIIISNSDPRKKTADGVPVYAYNLTKFLTSNGIEVIFFGKAQHGKKLKNFKNFSFVPVTGAKGSSNYAFLHGLYKLSRNFDFSDCIIHAQRPDWLAPFKKVRCKKVVTLHGSHRKNVFLKKGKLVGAGYSVLEKIAFDSSDLITSVSEENTDYFKKIYRFFPKITKKIVTIPIAIDLDRFNIRLRSKSAILDEIKKRLSSKASKKSKDRLKAFLGPKKATILYVGRLAREKNVDMLIRACGDVAKKIPRIRLLIIGTGSQKKHLQDLSDKLGVNSLFVGLVENSLIPLYMKLADVFALSSLYEGLPTVVIEALASGLPVVSTDVGDVPKLVINGKTGYLATQNTFANKLALAIKNKDRLAKNCAKKAKKYSWSSLGKQMIYLYRKL